MKLQILIVILIVVIIIGACLISFVKCFTGRKSCCAAPVTKVKAKKLKAPIGSLTVRISGMRCDSCRRTVMAGLNALEGISAKVSLETNTATVSFERPINDSEITETIERAGFEVLDIIR